MVLDCPHCGSERTGFVQGGERQLPRNTGTWNTLFMCRKCQGGIVVKLRLPAHIPRQQKPSGCTGDPRDDGFDMLAMYPKPQPVAAPQYVPDDIAGNFVEAVDNLRRGSFTSAGMMFRRVLEQATLEIGPGLERQKLVKRIDTLAEQHNLTPAMKDWAHIIRLEGNDAAHEDQFEKGDAEQMHWFTELFLIYVYSLPARVKKYRAQVKGDGQADA